MMRPYVTAALAALALVLPADLSAQEAAPAPSLAPAVSVVRAVDREVVERAIVTGTLVPREEILVAPEVEGLRITEVLVEEGAVVSQGQVLARLSRDILETTLAQNTATLARTDASIAQARSQIVQAEAAQVEAAQALERTRALIRGGNATEVQLEQRVSAARAAEGRLAAAQDGLRIAEAERRTYEAARREIEVRLARTEIKAPQGGIVSRKNARIGATATAAGDPLFRIIARGEIELEGEVTETQILRIREGAPARVSLDGGRVIEGRVRNVFPEVDRATRLGKVRITLGNDPALRIGAFARGTVELARRTGVAVPTASVIYGLEGATVQVVVNDRVQARRVRTGLQADGIVEIQEGVAAGELVVAKAGSFLRDGDAVRPVVAEQTAKAQ
ncbi:MAG TPA: efflux RND transporter periplasmic adaptor subunit [Microvirga sp.]|jgi:RND family efflux transporter MFP subunit|nr:efflux RND transporter periplasmic adaptor subunit [Microvirga sp.]